MLSKSEYAVWSFDQNREQFQWINEAAEHCFAVADPLFKSDVAPALIAQLQATDLNASSNFTYQTKQGRTLCFDIRPLGVGIYLFCQSSHVLPVIPDQEQNSWLSLFNMRGELVVSSQLVQQQLTSEQNCFKQRFVHPEHAQQLWQAFQTEGSFEGHFKMHTGHGEFWHYLQASKYERPDGECLLQLRELNIDPFIRNEHSLRTTLFEQEVIFQHAGTGICFIQDDPDKSREIRRCNRKFAEIFGYSIDELIGQNSSMLYPTSQSYQMVGNNAYPKLMDGTLYTQRLQMRRRDGSLFWSQIRGSIISTSEPGLGYIWIVEDINDFVDANNALETILNEQSLILDHAMVGIVFLKNREVTRCNRRFEEMFGYAPGELAGSTSRQWYLSDEDWEAAGEACYLPLSLGEAYFGEMLLARKDGTSVWCEVRSKAIDPEDLAKGSIWITMDISERKAADEALKLAHEELEQRVIDRTSELATTVTELNQEVKERKIAEERVKHMALHDALTGLPNRLLLEERLENAIALADAHDQQLAVLFIDLDRFKLINDSYGHHEGDQLLIEVSGRLHEALPEGDTVARLGGDEFVVLLNDTQQADHLNGVIGQIQAALKLEINLALQTVFVTPSIGVALFPQDGRSPVELMKNADAAMYHAKDHGRNCVQFFNQGLDQTLQERVGLENALAKAIQQNEFELYYQPQVDVRTNLLVGAEALIRWNHPEKGLISPDAFIPLAEETGMIVDIGHWVLEQVCKQLLQWDVMGLSHFSVSVNLSALQLQKQGFAHEVAEMMQQYGIQKERLDLELTESVIMRNAEDTIAALDLFHTLGVQISVDDFGTGYSSLSYLKRFPLDKLKIDRSFVQDITIDLDDAMICRTIISMAHNLGLKVVAEGVETHDQLKLLKSYGCELYQGYLFSKPLPLQQFTALLR